MDAFFNDVDADRSSVWASWQRWRRQSRLVTVQLLEVGVFLTLAGITFWLTWSKARRLHEPP